MKVGAPTPFVREPGGQYSPAVSPNGRWVAYTSDESGRAEIYVVPFRPPGPAAGGKWQVSIEGGIYPVWSRRGRELFFRSGDRHVTVAAYAPGGESFVTVTQRQWAAARLDATAGYPSFDVSADGARALGFFESESAKTETALRVLLTPALP